MNDHPTRKVTALPQAAAVQITTILLALFAPMALQGQGIFADFNDGNTTSEVDGWTGMAGDGWATAWGSALQNAGTFTGEVSNSNPLAGGGNYLQLSIDNGSSLNWSQFHRQYENFGSIALNQPHEVSFLLRQDTIGHNRARLFDSDEFHRNPRANRARWILDSAGDEWTFEYWDPVAGANASIDTGVVFGDAVVGDVFEFRIQYDPSTSTYVGFVQNLDYQANVTPGIASFTTGSLRFLDELASPAGYLNFNTRVTADAEFQLSFDRLHIIPEPGTFSLAALGMAFGLRFLTRRRRS